VNSGPAAEAENTSVGRTTATGSGLYPVTDPAAHTARLPDHSDLHSAQTLAHHGLGSAAGTDAECQCDISQVVTWRHDLRHSSKKECALGFGPGVNEPSGDRYSLRIEASLDHRGMEYASDLDRELNERSGDPCFPQSEACQCGTECASDFGLEENERPEDSHFLWIEAGCRHCGTECASDFVDPDANERSGDPYFLPIEAGPCQAGQTGIR